MSRLKSIGRKARQGAKKAAKVAGRVNRMAADRIAKPALEALANPGGSARDLSRDVSDLIKDQMERRRFKEKRRNFEKALKGPLGPADAIDFSAGGKTSRRKPIDGAAVKGKTKGRIV